MCVLVTFFSGGRDEEYPAPVERSCYVGVQRPQFSEAMIATMVEA